ncbi:hypothetical protein QE152_g16 [Popillia japonica]|uniref:Uncharacterized protein n=1 Tax=Popillia japonica TaxID=7064 RepID=A0AAW1NHM5_POPJA
MLLIKFQMDIASELLNAAPSSLSSVQRKSERPSGNILEQENISPTPSSPYFLASFSSKRRKINHDPPTSGHWGAKGRCRRCKT